MSLSRDFSKSINYKIISKLLEKFATKSEIIGVNLIKIGPEMTSGYLFEKMWFYMKYIVKFLSGNRYMAHNCTTHEYIQHVYISIPYSVSVLRASCSSCHLLCLYVYKIYLLTGVDLMLIVV